MPAASSIPAAAGDAAGPLERRLTLGPALTTTVLAMVGVGPFVTIPLLLQTANGPQAMIGWGLGAVIALADGLVLAELGAAIPRSGGGYAYVLEAYGPQGLGRMVSFLYLWSMMLTGPFVMASGAIGFSQYAAYLAPGLTPLGAKALAAAVCLAAAAVVYRRIDRVGRWAAASGALVLGVGVWIIVEGFRHADPRNLALAPGALTPSPALFAGLGGATLYALYDYAGYSAVCAVGGEALAPARTIPRAIVFAIGLVAALYLSMSLAVISAEPWREAARSRFVASELIARLDGPAAGAAVTVLILAVTLAGLAAGMLALSRLPFAAAVDGRFFSVFARTDRGGGFPNVSVAVIGVASALCCLLDLDAVIKVSSVAAVIVSSLAVVAAPTLLRRRRPPVARPFSMWAYPLPSLVAAAGWTWIVVTSAPVYIATGLAALVLGSLAYLWRARGAAAWPWARA